MYPARRFRLCGFSLIPCTFSNSPQKMDQYPQKSHHCPRMFGFRPQKVHLSPSTLGEHAQKLDVCTQRSGFHPRRLHSCPYTFGNNTQKLDRKKSHQWPQQFGPRPQEVRLNLCTFDHPPRGVTRVSSSLVFALMSFHLSPCTFVTGSQKLDRCPHKSHYNH